MELPALSQHEHALKIRALRNQVLSSNIANADTPNYKARDIDFKSALQAAQGNSSTHRAMPMLRTDSGHQVAPQQTIYSTDLKYRIPQQPTLDGNTVETDVEQAAFLENALQYRASLAFLDGQIRGLRYAIRGSD